MEPDEIYRECIVDIESITSLFDGGHCRQVQLARQRLKGLKAKWAELERQYKGTAVEGVIQDAAPPLPNANTRPEGWVANLYETKCSFTLRLSHQPRKPEGQIDPA
jgi:hypothetical protein